MGPDSSQPEAPSSIPFDNTASPQGDERAHERTLVAHLRDSNPEAVKEIMSRYTNRLVRFAFYTTGSTDTAEDIVQHVFIRLWERRAALPPDLQLKSYLFRAVRNRALNEHNADMVRDRFRTQAQDDAAAGTVSAMAPNPESGILTRVAVQGALMEVSERRRLALQLRLAEEMTYGEIAEVLGISFVAAQHLVVRALADLRQQLWAGNAGAQKK